MPLTSREAFKVGFMSRCADESLSPAEVQDRLQKAAAFLEKRAFLPSGEQVASGLGTLGSLAGTAAIAAPIGLGALGGYLANKAREADVDAEDVRTRELIAELHHFARRAKEQRKAKLLHLA